MCLSIFLLWLVSISLSLYANSLSIPDVRGFLLNCGADPSNEVITNGVKYISDVGFTSSGNRTHLKASNLLPILTTLRYFPDPTARKYCYEIPVIKGGKYLLRTTYYYGRFDGGKEPPVFDQIVDGTKWSIVNTTEDHANGLSSFYELVVVAMGKMLSVCLARNEKTISSPFISALELEFLEDSLYNTTDFGKYALSTVARSSFGSEEDMIGYPDDQFNRLWQPFLDKNLVVTSHFNVTSSDFWNLPPPQAFSTAISTSEVKKLQIMWPPMALPNTSYYISLYFQDNRTPSPYSWRVFDVSLNGRKFFTNLNATTNGVTVYSTQWPLFGLTEIVLTPANGMNVGPLINAGEVFQIVPLGGRTLTRDVVAMEKLARSFNDPPSDWSGDPCLPKENSWTGVTCFISGKFARVIAVNLTNAGLSGSLSSSIDKLTALTHLWLGGNNLSGKIPEMSSLKALQTLNLENNKFEGEIPQSLGLLPKLHELYLQNNNLDTRIPTTLQNRKDMDILVSS
ncbi:putative leucine-rich repeat receptor-like serine/threonine-protein kinase At2g14440 isoform X1 [Quercus lobata]|uniref:putative leucine-rich repeat receptor-like serine/threonine-protein kinase At2g14440 isoform X1 n=1 Tax=Quercus lobata TaxID=97700 RepID=UPI001243C477|nr:putative leucine-rich repeat receptor-like serine/threonine-protein kinase At2g14440 isoform X1 [Quercus lobata]